MFGHPLYSEVELLSWIWGTGCGLAVIITIPLRPQVVFNGDGWAKEFEDKGKVLEPASDTNGGFWDRLERDWQDLAK